MENKGYNILHNLAINSSPQAVFDAVSDPQQLIKWWPKKCSGKAVEGAIYNFYFTDEYDWFGLVIQCIPAKSFHIKMTESDADWSPTSFGFDIQYTDGLTQLQFQHIGWEEDNAHFRHTSFCWALLLKGLKDFLEKGIVVPFEERE